MRNLFLIRQDYLQNLIRKLIIDRYLAINVPNSPVRVVLDNPFVRKQLIDVDIQQHGQRRHHDARQTAYPIQLHGATPAYRPIGRRFRL